MIVISVIPTVLIKISNFGPNKFFPLPLGGSFHFILLSLAFTDFTERQLLSVFLNL